MSSRLLRAVPLTLTVLWLFADSPHFFVTEAQFALEILALTLLTRSIDPGLLLAAFSLGVGVVAPAVTLLGKGLLAAGVDIDNESGNWFAAPLLEETLKLLPAVWLGWRRTRRTGLPLNGSDWLALSLCAGLGFAMVENAYFGGLKQVYRYGPSAGPFYLFPTAWGKGGYIGHAAGTAFVGLGFALALIARRRRLLAGWWWTPAVAAFAWIAVEHMCANMYVTEGFDAALWLGAGRLTPYLFIAGAAVVVWDDGRRARGVWAGSPKLRRLVHLMTDRLKHAATAGPVPAWRGATGWLAAIRLLNRVAAAPPAASQELRT